MGFLDVFKRKKIEVPDSSLTIQTEIKKQIAENYRILNSMRSFNSANVNRLNESFRQNADRINESLKNGLRAIRNLSRNLALNNSYYSKYLNMSELKVVGPKGFTFVSKAKGQNGKLDTNDCKALEDFWKMVCKKENFTVKKDITFYRFCRMLPKCIKRDGEVFIRKVYGYDNEIGFSLQVIDPEFLDEKYSAELSNGNYIRCGIEFNSWGVRVKYHFSDFTEKMNEYGVMTYSKNRTPINANEIIHLFNQNEYSQIRGYPDAQQVFQALNMINGYNEAELVKNRASACFTSYIIKKTGDAPEYEGTSRDGNGNKIEDMEAGIRKELDWGQEVHDSFPQSGGANQAVFLRSNLREVASGMNVSYNSLANDGEAINFSTMRTFMVDERNVAKMDQNSLIEEFCSEVYYENLKYGLMNRLIIQKNTKFVLPPSKLEKFKEHNFKSNPFEWIDPKNDAEAAVILRDNGLDSATNLAQRDIEDIMDELDVENKMAIKSGVPIRNMGGNAQQNIGGSGNESKPTN